VAETQTFDRFLLDGRPPRRLSVRDAAPPESATQLYSVVADYGWAERVLCSGSCLRDANDLALTVAEYLRIPVHIV
jgi:hypothetical protein